MKAGRRRIEEKKCRGDARASQSMRKKGTEQSTTTSHAAILLTNNISLHNFCTTRHCGTTHAATNEGSTPHTVTTSTPHPSLISESVVLQPPLTVSRSSTHTSLQRSSGRVLGEML